MFKSRGHHRSLMIQERHSPKREYNALDRSLFTLWDCVGIALIVSFLGLALLAPSFCL